MPRIKGPAVFLAQFLRDQEPFSTLDGIGRWFAGLGFKGVQIPAWDRRVLDLDAAAKSAGYCQDLRGRLADMRLEITELAGYLQGQVLAVHPAYSIGFSGFHPAGLTESARTDWAANELKKVHPGVCQPGAAKCPRTIGRLRVAPGVSVAPAASRFDRRGIRGACSPLASAFGSGPGTWLRPGL